MSPLFGPFLAAVFLLVVSALAKLRDPAATRVALRTAGLPGTRTAAVLLALGELGLAVGALVVGGPWTAAALALGYLGFALFSLRLHRATAGVSCGCFGGSSAPVGPLHVAVNLGIAALVGLSVVWPNDGISAVGDSPAGGAVLVLLSALLAWLLMISLTALPELLAAKTGRSAVAA